MERKSLFREEENRPNWVKIVLVGATIFVGLLLFSYVFLTAFDLGVRLGDKLVEVDAMKVLTEEEWAEKFESVLTYHEEKVKEVSSRLYLLEQNAPNESLALQARELRIKIEN